MECDGIHSLIERKLKNINICLPYDYVKTTMEARIHPNKLEAILLTHDYFLNFKQLKVYHSIRPGYDKEDPEVKDLRALIYEPSLNCVYFKLIFDEPYSKIPQKATRQKLHLNDNITEDFFPSFNRSYKNSLPITLSKWQDLQNIKKVLPVDIHPFYDDLSHCNNLKPRKGNI